MQAKHPMIIAAVTAIFLSHCAVGQEDHAKEKDIRLKVSFRDGTEATLDKVATKPGDSSQDRAKANLPGPILEMEQGGKLSVAWDKLKELSMGTPRIEGNPYTEYPVTLTLVSGETKQLLKVTCPCVFIGESDIGETEFKLYQVKRIVVLPSSPSGKPAGK